MPHFLKTSLFWLIRSRRIKLSMAAADRLSPIISTYCPLESLSRLLRTCSIDLTWDCGKRSYVLLRFGWNRRATPTQHQGLSCLLSFRSLRPVSESRPICDTSTPLSHALTRLPKSMERGISRLLWQQLQQLLASTAWGSLRSASELWLSCALPRSWMYCKTPSYPFCRAQSRRLSSTWVKA